MIASSKVPWPLWLFAAIGLVEVVRLEVRVDVPVMVMILYPVLMFAWLYFLFRGVRWVWLASLAVEVFGFAIGLISGSLRQWGTMIGLVELGLLLLPVTRRYFSTEQTRTSGEAALDHSG